jgi:hypothetical protein
VIITHPSEYESYNWAQICLHLTASRGLVFGKMRIDGLSIIQCRRRRRLSFRINGVTALYTRAYASFRQNRSNGRPTRCLSFVAYDNSTLDFICVQYLSKCRYRICLGSSPLYNLQCLFPGLTNSSTGSIIVAVAHVKYNSRRDCLLHVSLIILLQLETLTITRVHKHLHDLPQKVKQDGRC